MKTYDLEVSRTATATIRVTVPDDFSPVLFVRFNYGDLLGQVADDQMRYGGWNEHDRSVEVTDIVPATDDGEFAATDIAALLVAENQRRAALATKEQTHER